MHRGRAMSMHADVGNPFVVPHVCSTDGHFTKVFGGKKIREKLGKMLPLEMRSDAAKWKHMLQDKRYSPLFKDGVWQTHSRDSIIRPAVFAYEYLEESRRIVECAVLERELDQRDHKTYLLIQYWYTDNVGDNTTETKRKREGDGNMLFDTKKQR